MPTISYDFTEAAEGGDFVIPSPGHYVLKVLEVKPGKSSAGNPKAEVRLQIVLAEPSRKIYEGGVFTQHMPTTGAAAFRFQSLLAALGIPKKKKGSIKIEKYYGNEIGVRLTNRTGDRPNDAGEFAVFADLSMIVPGAQMREMLEEQDDEEYEDEEEELEEEEDEEDEEEEDEDDEDDEEEEDDEDEEEEEDEDEEDDEDDEEEEEDDEEYLTPDDLKDMNLEELKELAKEYSVSTRKPSGKNLTAAIMRKRLQVIFEEEEGDEEDGEEDPF